MIEETCGNCKFYRRLRPLQPMGTCRHGPPKPLIIGAIQDPMTKRQQAVSDSFWPQIPDTEWCGGWVVRSQNMKPSDIDLTKLDVAELEGSA